ncbi:MAG TPA: peptidylprolyl isomerase [Gemmatimonadaceae bacterium]|nr:peptidylprolyl isomerase [Gemmatimonadaceae bacterium]
MKRSLLLLAGAVVGLSACDSFKEAMTAHVDTAARAGSQELSVEQLATMLGEAPLPLNEDVARQVAQFWVNYQLLGVAAANADSLDDSATVTNAMWAQYASIKFGEFMQNVGKDWVTPAPAPTESAYNQGDVLAARHILIGFPGQPGQPVSEQVRDSVRRVAEQVRAQVTPANFAQMARQHSTDPGSAAQGGDVGVFEPGMMVPEFARGTAALEPGQISQPVLSPFGYHIIMRTPFAEVNKEEYSMLATRRKAMVAESTYVADLKKGAKLTVRPNVAKTVKAVAQDPDGHRKDKTVLATSSKGDFTAGRLAQWIVAMPPDQRMREQVLAMPDSVTPQVVEFFAQRDLLLAQADSAKVTVDSTQQQEIHRAFVASITSAWSGLGVRPSQLADSAKSEGERERLAAERVNHYFAALLRNEAPVIPVPGPVEAALRDKYKYDVNAAGIDRALELAARVRARSDSARAAQQPPTAVPVPGATPKAPQSGGAAPQQAPPQQQVPPQAAPQGAPPAGR